MKKILFDIVHPAHVNLFKNAINILSRNHEVYITILDRGILKSILLHELPDFDPTILTKRSQKKWGLILINNLFRAIKMFVFMAKKRPDVAISCGQVSLSLPSKILRIPNYQFSDDAERKLVVFVESMFSTKKYFPPVDRSSVKYLFNTIRYNAMKQWAYLHPNYFNPNLDSLKSYSIAPKKYFFIREIVTDSFNYLDQSHSSLRSIQIPHGYKVLLSLEDKTKKDIYPKDWIILKEPVRDFYSLMYYSACVISSGDSMAREAALLGTPSIYAGVRDMAANRVLIQMGLLNWMDVKNVESYLALLVEDKNYVDKQPLIREELKNQMDDLTQLIINCSLK